MSSFLLNATVIDGARFFRRESFLQIGGFDISLNGTEDWDIDRRIKNIGEFSIIKSNLFHHENHNLKKYNYKEKLITLPILTIYFKKWGFERKLLKNNLDFIIVILACLSKKENGKNYSLILCFHFQCIFYYFKRLRFILSKFNISKKKAFIIRKIKIIY